MESLSCEILVIGAGITGLTVARELVMRGAEDILILEKEPSAGYHASGRNSGVLHAGIYYSPDSLKARFCIEGNRLMKAYCRAKGLKLRESGKVIVVKEEEEMVGLLELKRRADENGAKTEIVDEQQLKEIEPCAKTISRALYSPETAVIDPLEILNALVKELISTAKARILTSTKFLTVKDSSLAITDRNKIKFKLLINSAGAYSEEIAHRFGLGKNYKIIPFKGTYMKLKKEKGYLVRGNIYPVPDIRNPFLGVHFTKSVNDVVYIGPTAIPALGRENYRMFAGAGFESVPILWRNLVLFLSDSSYRHAGKGELKKFFTGSIRKEAEKLVNGLDKDDMVPSEKVGIRPQLYDSKTKTLVMDFVVLKDNNSIHILNAISPAFTSSFAFARMIADMVI